MRSKYRFLLFLVVLLAGSMTSCKEFAAPSGTQELEMSSVPYIEGDRLAKKAGFLIKEIRKVKVILGSPSMIH